MRPPRVAPPPPPPRAAHVELIQLPPANPWHTTRQDPGPEVVPPPPPPASRPSVPDAAITHLAKLADIQKQLQTAQRQTRIANARRKRDLYTLTAMFGGYLLVWKIADIAKYDTKKGACLHWVDKTGEEHAQNGALMAFWFVVYFALMVGSCVMIWKKQKKVKALRKEEPGGANAGASASV